MYSYNHYFEQAYEDQDSENSIEAPRLSLAEDTVQDVENERVHRPADQQIDNELHANPLSGFGGGEYRYSQEYTILLTVLQLATSAN